MDDAVDNVGLALRVPTGAVLIVWVGVVRGLGCVVLFGASALVV